MMAGTGETEEEEEGTITGSFCPSACKIFFLFLLCSQKEEIALSELQDAH